MPYKIAAEMAVQQVNCQQHKNKIDSTIIHKQQIHLR